jgi:hypothetical protein
MKIKSNVRAGSGGASGGGQNGTTSGATGGHSSQAVGTTGFYFPAVSRCVGI